MERSLFLFQARLSFIHLFMPLSLKKKIVLVASLGFGINLNSFFPCNQLTATSYIYQTLGDVEWYVR